MSCKLTERKQIRLLAFLGWMIHFSSHITQINFGIIIVEFIQAEGVMKSSASVVTTALLTAYGIGQLISGFLGDKFSPRLLIFGGLLAASVCNILLPVAAPSIAVMAVIWGVNGIAQAMLWPPLVKICSSALNTDAYNRIMPVIGTGCALATIAVHMCSPLMITLSGWRLVFYVAAAFAVVVAPVWFFATGKLLKNVTFSVSKSQEVDHGENKTGNTAVWKLLPIILLSVAMLGILRDGINTWVSTYISETFKIESTDSILTTAVIPLTHMFVGLSTYWVLMGTKRDVFAAISVYFAITVGFLLLLLGAGTSSVVLSVMFIALGTAGLHGIGSLQTYYLPELLGGTRKISFYAGLINASTYVGSALSTYLFAVISEKHGWDMTIISWVIFATVGLSLTMLCMFVLRKNHNAGRV